MATLVAKTINVAATSIMGSALAGRVRRLHRDGGRSRGYQGENARRRLAGDRLKISPARAFIQPAGFVRRNVQEVPIL
jgi:hypothetical protein